MEGESLDYGGAAVRAWSRLFPDLDVLDYSIVLRLLRAGMIIEARLRQVTAEQGFAARGDYDVLSTLRRAHPTPLRALELADRVMISTPGITGRLDRLEARGLVARTPHPTDRRAIFVEITADGIEAADSTFLRLLEAAGEMLGETPGPVKERLAHNLQQLMVWLGDDAPPS